MFEFLLASTLCCIKLTGVAELTKYRVFTSSEFVADGKSKTLLHLL